MEEEGNKKIASWLVVVPSLLVIFMFLTGWGNMHLIGIMGLFVSAGGLYSAFKMENGWRKVFTVMFLMLLLYVSISNSFGVTLPVILEVLAK